MDSDFLSRALNTQPDPDMERVLVALGCDGDSLHDLLVAAEAMRAENERLRAAGGALAKWLWHGGALVDVADMIAAVSAWEEACRA